MALAFAVVGLLAGSASATSLGTVTATFQTYPPPPDAVQVRVDGWTYDVFAGRFGMTKTAATWLGQGISPTFTVYCVDLNQTIAWGSSHTYDIYPLAEAPKPGTVMGATKANLIKDLFFTYGGLVDLGSNDQEKRTRGGAIALGIWEIVNETGTIGDLHNTTGGAFKLVDPISGSWAADARDLAETWLATLDGVWAGGPSPDPDLFALVDTGSQDFTTTIVINGYLPPVPEPVTMFGVMAGLSSLGMYIRRRMRAPAVA
jgi:hypothetical protein